MKSLGGGLRFEDIDDARFSSTHANAARAVESTLSAFSPLPCKKNKATMGSEELMWLDRAYTFVSRPATFRVSFITSPILQLLDELQEEGGVFVLTSDPELPCAGIHVTPLYTLAVLSMCSQRGHNVTTEACLCSWSPVYLVFKDCYSLMTSTVQYSGIEVLFRKK